MPDVLTHLLLNNNKTMLLYVAQAGFVIKSAKGTTIGIDLYLSDCVERHDGFKRLSPKVLSAEKTVLDYIVATHWHLDHFDIDAMPLLMVNGVSKLLCTNDCKEHVEQLYIDNKRVQYITEGDILNCRDIVLNAVFCDHGASAPQAVGLVIVVDGYKVYIAGDTSFRLDKASEISKYGPFDIMIAPINGAFGNLSEKENVELCRYHKPRLSIPCHFWTFAEQHGDPGVWAEIMKKELPNQKFLIMAPGEQLDLDTL